VIIGKIKNNEKLIKFQLKLFCTQCGKSVPGGMRASEKYYNSDSFRIEIEIFKKKYLCGICRDAKRIKDKIQNT